MRLTRRFPPSTLTVAAIHVDAVWMADIVFN